eukprot:COSAG02_NODE_13613_length_1372_cov_1.547526_1_plen_129_part_00
MSILSADDPTQADQHRGDSRLDRRAVLGGRNGGHVEQGEDAHHLRGFVGGGPCPPGSPGTIPPTPTPSEPDQQASLVAISSGTCYESIDPSSSAPLRRLQGRCRPADDACMARSDSNVMRPTIHAFLH